MGPRLARFIAGISLVLALVGCPGSSTGRVLGVTIAGGDRSLAQGARTVLAADVRTTGEASSAVVWTSSAPAVATIADDGTLDALEPGTASITAISVADAAQNDTIAVTVDPPGALRWTRQFGTGSDELTTGVASTADGKVYVTGYTLGALVGTTADAEDVVLRACDVDGAVRWTRQFGSADDDQARAIVSDADGDIYATGLTYGDVGGAGAGGGDGFLRAYAP